MVKTKKKIHFKCLDNNERISLLSKESKTFLVLFLFLEKAPKICSAQILQKVFSKFFVLLPVLQERLLHLFLVSLLLLFSLMLLILPWELAIMWKNLRKMTNHL